MLMNQYCRTMKVLLVDLNIMNLCNYKIVGLQSIAKVQCFHVWIKLKFKNKNCCTFKNICYNSFCLSYYGWDTKHIHLQSVIFSPSLPPLSAAPTPPFGWGNVKSNGGGGTISEMGTALYEWKYPTLKGVAMINTNQTISLYLVRRHFFKNLQHLHTTLIINRYR